MKKLRRGAHWAVKKKIAEDIKFFGDNLLQNYIPWLDQQSSNKTDQ